MIRLEHINLSFGEKQVLADFSLTLPEAGVTALSGPSGCGKTTLLRVLAGLEAPKSGQVMGIAPCNTAFLFQEDRLLPGRTVLQQLTDVISKDRWAEAPQWLELAELTGNDVWRSRARALWYNGTQLISDGTLVINNKVRPAGSQDESIRHTRWGRPDNRYFITSEWLTSWQGTYRQVALQLINDWDQLR